MGGKIHVVCSLFSRSLQFALNASTPILARCLHGHHQATTPVRSYLWPTRLISKYPPFANITPVKLHYPALHLLPPNQHTDSTQNTPNLPQYSPLDTYHKPAHSTPATTQPTPNLPQHSPLHTYHTLIVLFTCYFLASLMHYSRNPLHPVLQSHSTSATARHGPTTGKTNHFSQPFKTTSSITQITKNKST